MPRTHLGTVLVEIGGESEAPTRTRRAARLGLCPRESSTDDRSRSTGPKASCARSWIAPSPIGSQPSDTMPTSGTATSRSTIGADNRPDALPSRTRRGYLPLTTSSRYRLATRTAARARCPRVAAMVISLATAVVLRSTAAHRERSPSCPHRSWWRRRAPDRSASRTGPRYQEHPEPLGRLLLIRSQFLPPQREFEQRLVSDRRRLDGVTNPHPQTFEDVEHGSHETAPWPSGSRRVEPLALRSRRLTDSDHRSAPVGQGGNGSKTATWRKKTGTTRSSTRGVDPLNGTGTGAVVPGWVPGLPGLRVVAFIRR